MGKLLFVDLSSGRMEEETLQDDFCRKFIGGYGFGSKILFDRMKAGADPMGPENMLGFLTGPLTGTPALIGSRYGVVCKSPLTGTWGDANSGGYFGPQLKAAGYDGIFFSGQSEKPVYLSVENGKAELKDASSLWGKDSHETEEALKSMIGKDIRAACIGPAGESLSLISSIMNDLSRACGRSGVGAVMGSKRLKAVVARGSMPVPMADEALAKEIRRRNIKDLQGFGDILTTHGTCGITADSAISGDSPVKNWGGAGTVDFPNPEVISDDAVIAKQERKYACWHCPIACGGHMKEVTGKFAVPAGVHKPEYETLAAFGTLCLNDNLDSIIKINDICNRAGLDTISTGAAVGFAIECYENGVVNNSDTDGLELTWGNEEAIVGLTEKIAKREGLGDLLADGVKVASAKIGRGADEYAMHINGQELAMHDPRFTPGLALTFHLEATPARHTQGGELLPPPAGLDLGTYDRKVYTGRGKDQKTLVDITHVINSAGLCMFGYLCYDAQIIPEFLQAVTGWDWDMDSVLKAGERIANARRLFNVREGVNPLEWKVPNRMLGHPPLKEGNIRGIELDEKTMIREFLEVMDWDQKTMRPSDAKIKEMELEEMAAKL